MHDPSPRLRSASMKLQTAGYSDGCQPAAPPESSVHGTTSTGTSWRWSRRYDVESRMRAACVALTTGCGYRPGGGGMRYSSPSAARTSGSSTTSHRHSCRFDPLGAWVASRRHSRITSRGTARVRSRRLRTALVVESRWSTVARSSSVTVAPIFFESRPSRGLSPSASCTATAARRGRDRRTARRVPARVPRS